MIDLPFYNGVMIVAINTTLMQQEGNSLPDPFSWCDEPVFGDAGDFEFVGPCDHSSPSASKTKEQLGTAYTLFQLVTSLDKTPVRDEEEKACILDYLSKLAEIYTGHIPENIIAEPSPSSVEDNQVWLDNLFWEELSLSSSPFSNRKQLWYEAVANIPFPKPSPKKKKTKLSKNLKKVKLSKKLDQKTHRLKKAF